MCTQVYRGADNTEEGVYFPCRAWFDKERGMTKELFPMRRELDLPKVEAPALSVHCVVETLTHNTACGTQHTASSRMTA